MQLGELQKYTEPNRINKMNNDTPTPRTDAIHQKYITAAFAKQLERELTAMTKQRDRLAEALKMITTFDYTDLQCDNGHGPRSVATEALQSLTTNAKP